MHPHSAVERAANTVLCTRRMWSRRLGARGLDSRAGITVGCSPSDMASSGNNATCSPPSPPGPPKESTVIELGSLPGLQWTSRPWLELWVLPASGPPGSCLGFSDSRLSATTSGFFGPGNPRPEAFLDFLCLSKTCQAGYAAFLPRSFSHTSKMPRYQEVNEE